MTHYRSVLSFALSMMLIARFAAAQEASPVAPATLKALLAAPLSTPPAGAPHGDVTVIEYFDYNCPVCRALEPQLQKLLATDQRVRLVRKDWPIFGDASVYAAYSSFAASREGRYQAAHDALIASSKDLDKKEDVLAVLEGAGFDVAKIQSDIARHAKEYGDALARIQREAKQLGLRGTPGIIVGDQLLRGRVDYERLRQLVERSRKPSSARESRRALAKAVEHGIAAEAVTR